MSHKDMHFFSLSNVRYTRFQIMKGVKRMGRSRDYHYDNAIVEFFQMGLNPTQVWRKVNQQQLLLGQKAVISRPTIWRMYKKWDSDGRQGEVVKAGEYRLDDGTIMVYWKPKEKMNGRIS